MGIGTETCIRTAGCTRTPGGLAHLHLVPVKGSPAWVVRHKRTNLCDTARCRIVVIVQVLGGTKEPNGYPSLPRRI